ncbi:MULTISPECIES: hypothetical protein [Rathayibacter]|uniref:Asp23/Gls24 family envelope stress response protein n=1 Tax=Rathayibacter caricis DSM 15933 TaxID=1328867 RepID=A0A2T4UTV9_9MICO|nr:MULTISPECIES: hypothetical protein [Rathayibacter]KQQ10187.1 hypothetical protein ASF46_03630 [Rathayibacter sp. Leaf296]MCJ1695455.1 hypothetical protein [Rathayibacter caricis]PTL72974.1 hypothetical protein C1I63_09015 [Rathayibacter caricis DSM 15933]
MSTAGGVVAPQSESPSSVLTALVRAVPGVAMVVPARAEARDVLAHAATALAPSPIPLLPGSLGTASGGTLAEPVLVRIAPDGIVVSIDIGVAADASAPGVARAVGAVAREWCEQEHPERRARIAVRIAAVD